MTPIDLNDGRWKQPINRRAVQSGLIAPSTAELCAMRRLTAEVPHFNRLSLELTTHAFKQRDLLSEFWGSNSQALHPQDQQCTVILARRNS